MSRRPELLLAALGLLATGCASTNPQPSFDAVADQVYDRSGLSTTWPRSADDDNSAERLVADLLSQPLDATAAARIALLRNREVLATIEDLGIARADYAAATRLANPSLSWSRRTPSNGPGSTVEVELVENILDLLVQPARKRLAAVELEAAKLRLGQTMLDLVGEARAATVELLAAEESTDLHVVARDLAAAAAELARRQQEAGNLELAEVARLEAQVAEATVELLRAQLDQLAGRERLNVLLGLSGPLTEWTTTRRLPPLPPGDPPLDDLESLAITQRLDLGAARFGVDLVGRALALEKGTRFFPVGVEVGFERERELDGMRLRGPRIEIALPIFDTGAASVARLESEHRKAQRQLEHLAIEIRAEVRLARDVLLGARALVDIHEDVLLPSRRTVVDQTLRSYNMMLHGVYELLEARDAEIDASLAATNARREYWLAHFALERALGGRPLAVEDRGPDTPTPAETENHHDHAGATP